MKNILTRISLILVFCFGLSLVAPETAYTVSAATSSRQKARERKKAKKKQAAAKKKAKKKQDAAKKKAKKQQTSYKKDVRNEYADYQQEVERINRYNKRVTARQHRDLDNYLGLYGQVGYSSMLHNLNNDVFEAKPLGWVGGGAGLGYQLRYEHLLFHTGAEFMMYTSSNAITSPGEDMLVRSYKWNPPYQDMDFTYRFDHMRDRWQAGYVQLPLMLGSEFGSFYFLVGPKVGVNVVGSGVNSQSLMTTTVTDPILMGEMKDMENHGLVSNRKLSTSTTPLKFGLNCAAAFEAGLYLDRWIHGNASDKRAHSESFGDRLRYRISVFAEYGFLNIQHKDNVQNADKDMPVDIPTDRPMDVTPVSSLSVNQAALAKVNPFMVGVKLSIYYTLPRKQEKLLPMPSEPVPRMAVRVVNEETDKGLGGTVLNLYNVDRDRTISKTIGSKGLVVMRQPKGNYLVSAQKPGFISVDSLPYELESDLKDTLCIRLKPEAKPVEYYLCGYIQDAETSRPLEAQLILSTVDGSQVYNGTASEEGLFLTNLKAGTYVAQASMAGYMPLTDTLTFIQDTLMLNMQKVKEGKRVRIHHLYFATNRTQILPESEEALDALAQFLKDNPTVSILIIGHTDNVGSDAANMKLSAGRAEAVRSDLIMRGVDESRVDAEGHGEREPIADNDTEEGRAKNRRVEFTITSTGGEDIRQITEDMPL